MNRDRTISDEQLNAYIDGQLDLPEQSRLLEILRDDPDLIRRNCELQKVHELVRLTYQSEHTPETINLPRRPRHKWLMSMAAALLIGFGVLLGWFGTNLNGHSSSLIELAKTVHVNPGNNTTRPWRIMLHVSSNDPYRFEVLLDETENLLKSSLKHQQAVEVEILTNGQGLELVRNSNQPYALRLRALQDKFNNLVISACDQALTRLREKGIKVELLPKTRVVPSAIHEVLARQKQGWTYIRI